MCMKSIDKLNTILYNACSLLTSYALYTAQQVYSGYRKYRSRHRLRCLSRVKETGIRNFLWNISLAILLNLFAVGTLEFSADICGVHFKVSCSLFPLPPSHF